MKGRGRKRETKRKMKFSGKGKAAVEKAKEGEGREVAVIISEQYDVKSKHCGQSPTTVLLCRYSKSKGY